MWKVHWTCCSSLSCNFSVNIKIMGKKMRSDIWLCPTIRMSSQDLEDHEMIYKSFCTWLLKLIPKDFSDTHHSSCSCVILYMLPCDQQVNQFRWKVSMKGACKCTNVSTKELHVFIFFSSLKKLHKRYVCPWGCDDGEYCDNMVGICFPCSEICSKYQRRYFNECKELCPGKMN